MLWMLAALVAAARSFFNALCDIPDNLTIFSANIAIFLLIFVIKTEFMDISVIFPFEKDVPDIRDSAGIHPFGSSNTSVRRRRELMAVVAMGRNNEIGFRGDMPWHIPEDLRHFKELTMSHPVIMGRATWESIPRRPLPGRRNVVLSRHADFSADGAETARSIAEALDICPPPEIPFIIGGGSIYREAMPLLTRIYVTRIKADFPQADTFFPDISPEDWALTERSEPMLSKCGLKYLFETYESRHNQ